MMDLGYLGLLTDSDTLVVPLACRNGTTQASTSPTGVPTYILKSSAGAVVATGNHASSDQNSLTGFRPASISLSGYGVGLYHGISSYVVGGVTINVAWTFNVT